ncbi:ATP-binding cassette domain-containing protein [Microbacterium sp. AGC85]
MTVLPPSVATPTETLGDVTNRSALSLLLRNPLAVVSMLILLAWVAVAIAAPWLTIFPPDQVNLSLTNAPAFSGSAYLLGGDVYGRDVLSRLIASAPGALLGVLIVTGVGTLTGVTAGLIAGYYGKTIDAIGSWLFSVIMTLPAIVILIALRSFIGTSMTVAMAVLGALIAPSFFWMVRQLTRTVRNELYVDSARVSGLPMRRIIGRHVLAAVRGPLIIMTSFLAGAAVGIQAGLEFLGLGDPTVPSWGGMLTDAFNNIYKAPTQVWWPTLALGLVSAAFILLGTALRDTLQGRDIASSARERQRRVGRLMALEGAEAATATATATADSSAKSLLDIRDLTIAYIGNDRLNRVVRDVNLQGAAGEVVGLVGESGSGKTQTVFASLGLLPQNAIALEGSIKFDGKEVLGRTSKQWVGIRGSQIGYIPQDPMANLDPAFTIGFQLVEALRAQTTLSKRAARTLAVSMLDRVGIVDPQRTFDSYPHEISGGMAQRVLIAGAMACGPALLLADEPTTALDVTVQAEVLDLIRDLQQEQNMGVLIVTHNFGVVADICDRVVVMRQGEVVESGPTSEIFQKPQHEYTQMLLAALLDDEPARIERSDVR